MAQPPRGFGDRHIDRYPNAPLARSITSGTSPMGKVTMGSGVAAVDVVYPGLTATDIFTSLVPEISSISAVSSRATFLCVSSKVPGTGFTVAWGNGIGYPGDTVIHWTIGKVV
jgi:hypothetical protein